jgi:hypothetical protein
MFRTTFAALFIAAAALATVLASPSNAQPNRIQVGTLNCSLSSSIGLVIGSQRNVSCFFRADNAPDEAYVGTLSRIGIDIGVTSGGVIIWAVFADTNRYAGMLSGHYVGATAEASVAVGLGANVLVGGSNRSVALQPLSVQGQVGLNIAAGVGELDIHLAP